MNTNIVIVIIIVIGVNANIVFVLGANANIGIVIVKSSQVCFIVNSSTCTVHTYRELKLRYSQTKNGNYIIIGVNTIFNVIGVNVNKVIIFGVNANIVIVIGGLHGICSRASCLQTLWGRLWL